MLPPAFAQPRRSVLNSASCESHLTLNVLVPTGSTSRSATCDARLTRGLLRVTPAVKFTSRESPCISLCVLTSGIVH